MTRDKRFGLKLAGFSLLCGLGIGMYFAMNGRDIPLSMLAGPALGFLLGMALIFFDEVENFCSIRDEIDDFPALVADDVAALKRLEFTASLVYIPLTLLAALAEIVLLFRYQKWAGDWWSINVVVIGLIVAAVTLLLCVRAEWFQHRSCRLSWWIFAIPLVGFALSAWLGTYYAEPIELGGSTRMELANRGDDYVYDWNQTRASRIYIFTDAAEEAGGAADFDIKCKEEACLALLLIVIVVVCVLGSIFIPHFWVVATLLLLTLMGTIALRELLYSDQLRPRNWSW